MNNNINTDNILLNTILEWSKKHTDLIKLEIDDKDYYSITTTPMNQNACSMIFSETLEENKFDLCLGKKMIFERLKADKEYILDICESVFNGKVTELVWEWHGNTIKSRGQIDLKTGPLTSSYADLFKCFLVWGKTPRLIKYQKYNEN